MDDKLLASVLAPLRFLVEAIVSVSQSQFDADLTPFLAALTAYITAVNAYITAAEAAGVNLSTEDQEVKSAAAALATAQSALGSATP
jgi:hypothetical protein